MDKTVVISMCSVIITSLSLLYTFYKDKVRIAKEDGKTDEILRGIEKELRSIEETQKLNAQKSEILEHRLTKAEDSTKSAHKRIDGLMNSDWKGIIDG